MVRCQNRFGSSLTVVSGLEFNRLSTPMKQIWSSSSVTSASFKIAEIARFAAFVMASNTPQKWGAAGGFQCQFIPLFADERRIWSWSSFPTNSFISISPAMKLVPLSLSIILGQPRLAAILVNAFKKPCVSRAVAISNKYLTSISLFALVPVLGSSVMAYRSLYHNLWKACKLSPSETVVEEPSAV